MANSAGPHMIARLGLGIIFAILGYIIGSLIAVTGVFPTTIQWDNILLFLGLVVGLFFKELNTAFDEFFN